jgi:hypothetical protein
MHRLCKKIPEAMALLKPLPIFGRPERMPKNIQPGDSVICEYGNNLILCDDLKEMRELFAAHSHGATKSIAWHFVGYRNLPRLAQMGQQKREGKKRW